VSGGCAGQAGVCLGRRRQALCLGSGDNRGLFAFLLAPRCLGLLGGTVPVPRPAVPDIFPSRRSGGTSRGCAADAPAAPLLLGRRSRLSPAPAAVPVRALRLLRLTPQPSPHGSRVPPWGAGDSGGEDPIAHPAAGRACGGSPRWRVHAKPFLPYRQRCPRPGRGDVPTACRHVPAASLHATAELLQSFSHGLRLSRAGCAPRSPPAKGLTRHPRPKIPVKPPCYLLFSVAFAADSILYLFFL